MKGYVCDSVEGVVLRIGEQIRVISPSTVMGVAREIDPSVERDTLWRNYYQVGWKAKRKRIIRELIKRYGTQ